MYLTQDIIEHIDHLVCEFFLKHKSLVDKEAYLSACCNVICSNVDKAILRNRSKLQRFVTPSIDTNYSLVVDKETGKWDSSGIRFTVYNNLTMKEEDEYIVNLNQLSREFKIKNIFDENKNSNHR